MQSSVKDIWFRSELPLRDIAQRLGLQEVIEDCENDWHWIIGSLGDVKLDITRTHTKPPESVDTRIFTATTESLPESLVDELVRRLRTIVTGTIYCGRWHYRAGNDFDLEVFQEFNAPNTTARA